MVGAMAGVLAAPACPNRWQLRCRSACQGAFGLLGLHRGLASCTEGAGRAALANLEGAVEHRQRVVARVHGELQQWRVVLAGPPAPAMALDAQPFRVAAEVAVALAGWINRRTRCSEKRPWRCAGRVAAYWVNGSAASSPASAGAAAAVAALAHPAARGLAGFAIRGAGLVTARASAASQRKTAASHPPRFGCQAPASAAACVIPGQGTAPPGNQAAPVSAEQ